jgi:hypothetical protein
LVLQGDIAGDATLNEIFAATAAFWKSQGKAFWVFFA